MSHACKGLGEAIEDARHLQQCSFEKYLLLYADLLQTYDDQLIAQASDFGFPHVRCTHRLRPFVIGVAPSEFSRLHEIILNHSAVVAVLLRHAQRH